MVPDCDYGCYGAATTSPACLNKVKVLYFKTKLVQKRNSYKVNPYSLSENITPPSPMLRQVHSARGFHPQVTPSPL